MNAKEISETNKDFQKGLYTGISVFILLCVVGRAKEPIYATRSRKSSRRITKTSRLSNWEPSTPSCGRWKGTGCWRVNRPFGNGAAEKVLPDYRTGNDDPGGTEKNMAARHHFYRQHNDRSRRWKIILMDTSDS